MLDPPTGPGSIFLSTNGSKDTNSVTPRKPFGKWTARSPFWGDRLLKINVRGHFGNRKGVNSVGTTVQFISFFLWTNYLEFMWAVVFVVPSCSKKSNRRLRHRKKRHADGLSKKQ